MPEMKIVFIICYNDVQTSEFIVIRGRIGLKKDYNNCMLDKNTCNKNDIIA